MDSQTLPKLPADLKRPGERFRAPVPIGIVVGVLIGHRSGTDGRVRHRIDRLVKVLKPAPDLRDFGPESPAAATTTTANQNGDQNQDSDEEQDDAGIEWEDEDGDDSMPF
jgi:hypothetical protein